MKYSPPCSSDKPEKELWQSSLMCRCCNSSCCAPWTKTGYSLFHSNTYTQTSIWSQTIGLPTYLSMYISPYIFILCVLCMWDTYFLCIYINVFIVQIEFALCICVTSFQQLVLSNLKSHVSVDWPGGTKLFRACCLCWGLHTNQAECVTNASTLGVAIILAANGLHSLNFG